MSDVYSQPWCVAEDGKPNLICGCFGDVEGGPEVAEANARLIASSPELLVALKAIADESVFNQQRFGEDTDADYFLRCFRAVKDRARAAIAKAEGHSR